MTGSESPNFRQSLWQKRGMRWLFVVTLTVVLLELALSLFFVRNGAFGHWPLPPFGAITNPAQRTFLERRLALLDSDNPDTGHGAWDRELGWTNRPSRKRGEGNYTSNSWAARGRREYPKRKPAGTTRILCFGDSFTYCEEVDDHETWQHQLEQKRGDWEVINFGIGAYGTDQALLRCRRKAPGLDPDVVGIGIMLENINRNVNRYRPIYYPSTRVVAGRPRFVLGGNGLQLLPLPYATERALLSAVQDGRVVEDLRQDEYWIGPRLGLLRHFALGRLAGAYSAYAARRHRDRWLASGEEPFLVTVALLAAFHREARALGAKLAPILIFPSEKDMAPARLKERYWRTLTDDLRARNLPFLDLTEALSAESVGPKKLFRAGHLNARANGLVAAALGDWLESRLPR